ncbi:hypothetical protein VKT23_001058 [Stygiomarasmius scandens]|uniref:Uncharacterized protein n=1 Tax=Marasmiellus scandens TaxID=2682957 RepID=A0ABR1K8J6_9AGAR
MKFKLLIVVPACMSFITSSPASPVPIFSSVRGPGVKDNTALAAPPAATAHSGHLNASGVHSTSILDKVRDFRGYYIDYANAEIARRGQKAHSKAHETVEERICRWGCF